MISSQPPKVYKFTKYESEDCFHKVFIPEDKEYEAFDPNEPPNYNLPGYKLDMFQSIAAKVIDKEETVLVSAHSSSGKTTIAEYVIAKCLALDKKVIFTSPIKALSNQKFDDFNKKFKNSTGIITGDVSRFKDRSVLVITTEILLELLINNSELLNNVQYVIHDECHFIGNESRGHVWELSIMLLKKNMHMVLLSATMPNNEQIAEWIATTQKKIVHIVGTCEKPIPLRHALYSFDHRQAYLVSEKTNEVDNHCINEVMLSGRNRYMGKQDIVSIVKFLYDKKAYPCIIYCPSKIKCDTFARYMENFDFLTAEEKELVDKLINIVVDTVGNDVYSTNQLCFYRDMYTRGIFIHHSDLYTSVKEFTEICIESGLAKFICSTDTLSIGMNLSVKTVVFSSLTKFDGKKQRRLYISEFLQMAGRAGRRGKDTVGNVIVLPSIECSETNYTFLVSNVSNEIESFFKLDYNMIVVIDKNIGDVKSFYKKSLRIFQHPDEDNGVDNISNMKKILSVKGYVDGDGRLTRKGNILLSLRNIKHDLVLAEVIFRELLPYEDKAMLIEVLCLFTSNKSDDKGSTPIELVPSIEEKLEDVKFVFEEIFNCEVKYKVRPADADVQFKTNDNALPIISLVMGEDLEKVATTYGLYAPGLLKSVRELLNLVKKILTISQLSNRVKTLLCLIEDSLNEIIKTDI
uniref:Helicase ATP-binding domain-containing protein n=1 Tax=Parastrongyloides trichosuri TaxID=131310 RepID=A0A0N5A056_PARTI